MPGFGQTERGNNMTGLYQGMAQRERAQKRILSAETGSAHVLCPCSYTATSQVCVIATLNSVRHLLGCVSAVVRRDFSVSLRFARNSIFWKLPTKWRGCNAPSKNRATFPKTLQVPALPHTWVVLLYEQGHKTCAEPVSAVKTRF